MWIPVNSLSGYADSDQQSDENPLPNMQQQKTGTVNEKEEVSCCWLPLFHCYQTISHLKILCSYTVVYKIKEDNQAAK